MIYLSNSGTAYEIGMQHGMANPRAVQLAYEAWGQVAGVEKSKLQAGIGMVQERLQRFFPETLLEMQGIAAGSGLPYEQILTLNCFDAIIGTTLGAPCCSNIGFADSDVGVLLGKTADWNVPDPQAFTLWQHYRPEAGQGYRFMHYGCAGTLWTEGGLNEAGLAMVLNGLPVSGSFPDSVPWLALTRGVLQYCRDVPAAIEFLDRHDVMCWGFNLTLADAAGDLAFVEVTPALQAIRRPAKDYLIHTNHCLCEETGGRQMDETTLAQYGEQGLAENSLARYRNLERLVPEAPRTLAGMKALLRDRSIPGAISQNGEQGQHTVYAMIIAPQEGKMWGAEGYPPDVDFVEYQI